MVNQSVTYHLAREYLASNGDAAAKKVGQKTSAARDELVSAAQSAYASASKAGGSNYASMTSYMAHATATAKKNAFETWSESELKSYLDSYGVVRCPQERRSASSPAYHL